MGYLPFKEEACNLFPDYQPKTVNTDGWEPTRSAWKTLFPGITLFLCFLHSVLKITQRCKRSKQLLSDIKEKVWNVYHAITPAQFSQRIRRLREWAQTIPLEPVKEKVLDLVANPRSSKRLLSTLKHTGQVTHLIGLWIIRIVFSTPCDISIGIAIVPSFICEPWLCSGTFTLIAQG